MIATALLLAAALAGAPSHPAPSTSLRLVLNLPTYRLELWDGDEEIRSYPVTIGLKNHPTPTGGFAVTRIEWNPWWTPPDSKWAEGKDKTAPGPTNPMGRAKLQFDDLLYVHGSALTKQIGGAHSHGCVRLKNSDVLDLARVIALRAGVLPEEEIDVLERSSRRTRSVELPAAIPFLIRYALSDEVDGKWVSLKDPYGWGDLDGRWTDRPPTVLDGAAAVP